MTGRGFEGSMKGGSFVLLASDFGESASRPVRMGSALIWKGGGNEMSRPLTCSYSFSSSSRRPPTDRLKTQSTVAGGGRLSSKASIRGASKQQASSSCANEELETILCIDGRYFRPMNWSLMLRYLVSLMIWADNVLAQLAYPSPPSDALGKLEYLLFNMATCVLRHCR